MSYADLLHLFEKLEPLQKKIENIGNGLDGPALNETRNATYHLLKALNHVDVQKRDDELAKARRHAERAIYDCHEIILLNELNRLRTFKKDYKTTVVTDIIPDYVSGCQKADDAYRKIVSIRSGNKLKRADYEGGYYSQDRSDMYAEIEPHVSDIQKFNDKCEAAREELNKKIRRANKEEIWGIWGKVSAIAASVGAMVAIVAWLYPQ